MKPHLVAVAEVPEFLPGIAERLGDPAFTKSLATTQAEIIRFMQEPREHLDRHYQCVGCRTSGGARSRLRPSGRFDTNCNGPIGRAGSQRFDGGAASPHPGRFGGIGGSFLRLATVDEHESWAFAHPTIADALTDILRERPHMMAALLRGATIETILDSFVCEGAGHIRDAPTIPSTLDDTLVGRLAHVPDQPSTNWTLFAFLADRANEHVFQHVVTADPDILTRRSWDAHRTIYDPKILTYARAHRLGLLEEYRQTDMATRLEKAAMSDFDLSFWENEDILRLIPPKRLIALGIRLRVDALVNAPDRIAQIAEEADLSEDPESHFEHFSRGLDVLAELTGFDDATVQIIDEARQAVSDAIDDVRARKEAEDEPDHLTDWSYMSSASREKTVEEPPADQPAKRSVFDDVDR